MNTPNNNYVTHQYVGPYFVPHGWTAWNNQTAYQPLAVVSYNLAWYILKKPAPVGTLPTDQEYWAHVDNWQGQLVDITSQLSSLTSQINDLIDVSDENTENIKALEDYNFNNTYISKFTETFSVNLTGDRYVQSMDFYNNQWYIATISRSTLFPSILVLDTSFNFVKEIILPDKIHCQSLQVINNSLYITPYNDPTPETPNYTGKGVLVYSLNGSFIKQIFTQNNVSAFCMINNYLYYTDGTPYDNIYGYSLTSAPNIYGNGFTIHYDDIKGSQAMCVASTNDCFTLTISGIANDSNKGTNVKVYNLNGNLIRNYFLPVTASGEFQAAKILNGTVYCIDTLGNVGTFYFNPLSNREKANMNTQYLNNSVKFINTTHLNGNNSPERDDTISGNVQTELNISASGISPGFYLGNGEINGFQCPIISTGNIAYMMVAVPLSNGIFLSGNLYYQYTGGKFKLIGVNLVKQDGTTNTPITSVSDLNNIVTTAKINTMIGFNYNPSIRNILI